MRRFGRKSWSSAFGKIGAWASRHRVVSGFSAATIIFGVIGSAASIFSWIGWTPDDVCGYVGLQCASSSAPSAAPTGTASISPSSSVEPVVTGVGAGCRLGEEAVLCGAHHDREVFFVSDGRSCDSASLVWYLGGEPGVDVLGPDLHIAKGEGENCVITSHSGLPSESLKDLWRPVSAGAYSRGGQFRKCSDYRGDFVSCDVEHVSEVVYEGGGGDVDCDAKYSMFAKQPVGGDDKNIQLEKVVSGSSVTCTARLRADSDSLTASVRGLDEMPLPLKR